MYRLHGCSGLFGFGPIAECDQVERAQGPREAAPEVAVVARVLDHPTGDEGMRHLEQDSSAAAEERCNRRVAKTPHHAPRAEVAILGP
jgi:hypothetical protein